MSFISGLRPDGKASARQWTGWTARVNTGDGAAWRLAPGSPAWCTRGAAGAQVRPCKWAAGARQLEWVRNDKTDRPDPRPTPSRLVAAAGLRHPISAFPDGQPGEWSPRGRSWSPCMGVAQIRASSHFGPPPVRPHPDTHSSPPSSHVPLAPKWHHAATHNPWGSTWASGTAVDRKVALV
jgi:hypothetical protein